VSSDAYWTYPAIVPRPRCVGSKLPHMLRWIALTVSVLVVGYVGVAVFAFVTKTNLG
jgi:hypothetical protein